MRRFESWTRAATLGLVVAFCLGAIFTVLAGVGCSGAKKESADAQATQAPRPPGVLLEGVIDEPKATWASIHHAIGGPSALLPEDFVQVVAEHITLDPSVAAEILTTAPVHLLVGEPATSVPAIVAVFQFANPTHAREVLFVGPNARYTETKDGPISWLAPKTGPGAVGLAMHVRGTLIVGLGAASTRDVLSRYAAYAGSSLAAEVAQAKASISADAQVRRTPAGVRLWLRHDAIPTVRRVSDDGWRSVRVFLETADKKQREDHAGRPPDYGDADQMIGLLDRWVQGLLSRVNDVEKATISIDVGDEWLALEVQGVASVGTEYESALKKGYVATPTPLLNEPEFAALAGWQVDSKEAREEAIESRRNAVREILGKRLHDDKPVLDVLSSWERVRGDSIAWSVGFSHEARGVHVATSLADVGQLEPFWNAAIAAVRTPALSGLLRLSGKVDDAKASMSELTQMRTMRLKRQGSGPQTDVAIARGVKDGQLHIFLADKVEPWARVSLSPKKTLGEIPLVTRELRDQARGHVLSAWVAQPLRILPTKQGAESAPCTLFVSREEIGPQASAVLRAACSSALLREVVKLR